MSIKRSFSLIEVLIFVTILSLFLITSVTIITVSIRQNLIQTRTLKANHYNDEVLEWIRMEKEINWNTFAQNAANNTYCFETGTLTWSKIVTDKSNCNSNLGGMYRRYAVFSTDNPLLPTRVEVTVYTEWQEAGNSYSTKLNSIFTLWEG